MSQDFKEKLLKALEEYKSNLEKITTDFSKTVGEIKKDAFKKAETSVTAKEEKEADELIENL